MRVLLMSDFLPPHLGGVELQVQALAQAMSDEGHEVAVATVWERGYPTEEWAGKVRIVRLRSLATSVPWFSGDPNRRYHPPIPDPWVALGVRRLVRRFKPDVVQTHGWIAYSAALGLVRTGIPMVLSVRDYGYSCATRNLLIDGRICSGPEFEKCLRHASRVYGPVKGIGSVVAVFALRGWLGRRIRVIHSVSGHVARILQRDFLRATSTDPVVVIPDIVIIPNIVLTSAAATAAHAAGEAADIRSRLPARPYILFVGALQPHKGLGPLLAAYGDLVDPPPLVLIGTRWPDTPTDLPAAVTVLSDLAHSDVMRAWEGALFGVAPSIWPDPLPGVVREAMSVGRPVVGSRVGGIPDIIVDEQNGLLVEPGDVEALTAAMRRLIEDDELRGRLGAQAMVDVASFNPVNIANRYVAAYADSRRPDAPDAGGSA